MRLPDVPQPIRLAAQWTALCAGSAALAALFATAGLPAALLLGTMLAAIACGVAGFEVRVPRPAFQAAQSMLGVLVGHAVTGSIATTIAEDGVIMLLVVLVTVAASALVGWVLTRLAVLPGATAAWGSSPGGAAAMTAMAEAHGADPRFVALMQYVRVVCVALVATLVARLWTGPAGSVALPAPGPEQGVVPLLATLLVGLVGSVLGRRLRVPAGILLGPMVLVAALGATGLVDFAMPGWLLGAAYAGIGWTVGLRFTRGTLRVSLNALPALVVSSLALIALCGLWAWCLTRLLPIDPLTAYLATSPGGLDTVAIIAMGTGSDVSFVLAAQVLRLLVVLMTGPMIARLIARTGPRGGAASPD